MALYTTPQSDKDIEVNFRFFIISSWNWYYNVITEIIIRENTSKFSIALYF